MLCITNVALSDWPVNEVRDVDPADERIKGLLRAHYIVPMIPARSSRAAQPPEGESPQEEPQSAQRPARPRQRASSRSDG